jgi:hypothetical protein
VSRRSRSGAGTSHVRVPLGLSLSGWVESACAAVVGCRQAKVHRSTQFCAKECRSETSLPLGMRGKTMAHPLGQIRGSDDVMRKAGALPFRRWMVVAVDSRNTGKLP